MKFFKIVVDILYIFCYSIVIQETKGKERNDERLTKINEESLRLLLTQVRNFGIVNGMKENRMLDQNDTLKIVQKSI